MPVLGYDTTGASSSGVLGWKMGSVAAVGNMGIITKFHIAIDGIDGSNKGVKIGVYNVDQSTRSPATKTLVEQVEIDPIVVSDNNEIVAPEGNELSASTEYLVCYISNSGNNKIKFDNGGDYSWYQSGFTYANEHVSPWSGTPTNLGRLISVWVDYVQPGVLGYNVAGASKMGNSTIVYGGSYSTDEQGGIIQAFHVAIGQVYAPLDAVKIVVADCKQIDGDPSGEDVIEQVEIHPVILSDDNEVAAVGSNNLEADTKYYMGILSASGATKWKYDSGVGVTLWHDALAGVNYATWFPDPCRTPYSSSSKYAWSIWVDYKHPGVLGCDIIGESAFGSRHYKLGSIDVTDGVGGNITRFHCACSQVSAAKKGGKFAIYNCHQTTGDPKNLSLVEQVEIDPLSVSNDLNVVAPEGNLLEPIQNIGLVIRAKVKMAINH